MSGEAKTADLDKIAQRRQKQHEYYERKRSEIIEKNSSRRSKINIEARREAGLYVPEGCTKLAVGRPRANWGVTYDGTQSVEPV